MSNKINAISPANLVIIKDMLKKYIPQFFKDGPYTDEQVLDCVYCCMIDGGYVSQEDLTTLSNAGIDVNYFEAA